MLKWSEYAKHHINLLLTIGNYWTSNFATIGYDKIAFRNCVISFRNFFSLQIVIVRCLWCSSDSNATEQPQKEKKNVFRWRRRWWWRHRLRLPTRFNWTICEFLKCAVYSCAPTNLIINYNIICLVCDEIDWASTIRFNIVSFI